MMFVFGRYIVAADDGAKAPYVVAVRMPAVVMAPDVTPDAVIPPASPVRKAAPDAGEGADGGAPSAREAAPVAGSAKAAPPGVAVSVAFTVKLSACAFEYAAGSAASMKDGISTNTQMRFFT
jgi:hypothetical protein